MFIPLRRILCLLFCILQHFALRLASKHTAFSIKTHCVLRHFTWYLAPKCSAFCRILHCILLQIAQKLVQMAVLLNKNTFWWHLQLSPFCIKTNLRENRLFAASGRLVRKKGSQCVKILTENWTRLITVLMSV